MEQLEQLSTKLESFQESRNNKEQQGSDYWTLWTCAPVDSVDLWTLWTCRLCGLCGLCGPVDSVNSVDLWTCGPVDSVDLWTLWTLWTCGLCGLCGLCGPVDSVDLWTLWTLWTCGPLDSVDSVDLRERTYFLILFGLLPFETMSVIPPFGNNLGKLCIETEVIYSSMMTYTVLRYLQKQPKVHTFN